MGRDAAFVAAPGQRAALLRPGLSPTGGSQGFVPSFRHAPASWGGHHHHHHHHRRRARSFAPTTSLGFSTFQVCDLIDDETQAYFAELVVQVIAVFGGMCLVLGAGLATINLVFAVLNSLTRTSKFQTFMPLDFDIGAGPATLTRVRLQLAQLIALGLEVLLIGDILETLVKSTTEYTFDSLYKLGIVAAIRTGLSFFLGLETESIYERAKADGRLDGRDINYQLSQSQSRRSSEAEAEE